jgi:crotonobetainyl-CoA:carnitine CoA-transferase CaiB-like acyl-CoA transferase
MYRRRGPFIDGEPGIDRAAYFAFVNHSKTNLAVSLDDDPDALGPILDGCDVIVENYGPGRARRLGVDAATVGRQRPALLAVSSSGFGHTGPWSAYRAYAYNLQTSCCLNHLTRTREGEPAEIDLAWADLICGYAIATLVVAWAVGPGGRTGAALDFSMAEYIASRLNEYLAAASCGRPAGPEDGTNHQFPYAPSGTYPAAGPTSWVAFSVASDAQWTELKAALGNPPELDDDRFASPDSRWADHAALDDALGALTAGHQAAALADRLQAAGVPASAVLLPADLIEDPHLEARGFFTGVEHPVWGRRRLIGLPWQVLGEGPLALGPPPLLESVSIGGGS